MTATEATLLDALRAVPGVAAADLESDERPDGAGTLRLQLCRRGRRDRGGDQREPGAA